MKKHNFNAGPSILPREVIENTAQAILDFNGSRPLTDGNQPPCQRLPTRCGRSCGIIQRIAQYPRRIFGTVLGRWCQFGILHGTFNFLEKKAAYLNTGVWPRKP